MPVIQITRQPVVLAKHPSLGASNLPELVRVVKEKPGISYATAGAGSQHHIIGEWLSQLAGIRLTHVPYRGGGLVINDLLGGHVPLAILGSTPFIPLHKAGA